MSPPPQLSRSATGGLIGSIFGRKPGSGFPKTAPVSSKGGRREIPYLAGAAKLQARGPLFMRDMTVWGRPCGLHTTGPVPNAPKWLFWRFQPDPASRSRRFCPHSGFRIAAVGQFTRLRRAQKRKPVFGTGPRPGRPTAARRETSRSASTRPAARASARPASGRRRI